MAAAKKAMRLGKSGRTLLRESVGGVVQIQRWSAKQVQIEIEREAERKEDSGVDHPRKTSNYALNKWLLELDQIYSNIWGGPPAIWVKSSLRATRKSHDHTAGDGQGR